jgi:phosphatidylglycerol:prolipoprotein diacylglycerol transferase
MIAEALQFPNIDPVALHLGTLPIGDGIRLDLRWYALAYIAGLLLGWRWMVWLIRRDRLWAPGRPAMSVPQADDFLFWATLGVIIGGRLGYVLFYMLPVEDERAKIFADPLIILRLWEGGMAFHGGLIGVALAAIWFCRQSHVNEAEYDKLAAKHAVAQAPEGKASDYRRLGDKWILKTEAEAARKKAMTDKVELLRLGDLVAAAAPIGLFFGRIANFINGELWGRVTDSPLGMVFCNERVLAQNNGYCPAGTDPRYPSQLYEAALEGLVLFAIINIATLRFDSLRRPGLNSGLFLVFYGLSRALLEIVREPDAHMPDALRGTITMGMLLSIPMIILGLWLIRRAYTQPKLAAA